MIATLISFEAIEIAITSEVDPHNHILIEQKTNTDYLVVKEGPALRKLFQTMLSIKSSKIDEENQMSNVNSPLFICFSAKNRRITEPILKAICPAFQQHLIYFNIDKVNFGEVTFNRSLLQGRQISYGQGLSHLRPKQQLRIALASQFKSFKNVQYIFIEKYKDEIKQLKKEGFTNVIQSFDSIKYQQLFQKVNSTLINQDNNAFYFQKGQHLINKYIFSSQYQTSLAKLSVKIGTIEPFNSRQLSIQGSIEKLRPKTFYCNITPKSWINKPKSKEISSFIFHNSIDNRLYVARAARPRQFSNQEDVQIKVLSYYLAFFINPDSYSIPHDKCTALMKFSKIKKYENKGTWFNVRPYIEGISTLKQSLELHQYRELIQKGQLYGCKVKGLGGIILFSWLINESFTVKSLSQQACFIDKDKNISFLKKEEIITLKGEIYLCRTDYYSVFNMSNYKVLQDTFIINRFSQQTLSIKVSQLHQNYLAEISHILSNLSEEKNNIIRNLFVNYRWHTKLTSYYDLINYRLQLIRDYLAPLVPLQFKRQPSLLIKYPQVACLLIPEDYSYFMLPLKNSYFPLDFSYKDTMSEAKLNDNPYLVYMNKACSFIVYNLQFPVFSFMQWVKAGGRYQIIQYISMINSTSEDYLIMDKRLKMASTNEKKNVVLVVDHVECCQEILKRPKSVKTVFIYRLRKPAQTEDLGLISSDLDKKATFEQSDDQLIKVLCRWGKASQAFDSKIQLYDWVMISYSRIKCNFYQLCSNDNSYFSKCLHKAISTNRHRLKQLQQTYKAQSKHLYALPIIKQQQKILFNYGLYEFIHIKNLFTQILEGTWNFKLQTYQNASIKKWKSSVDHSLVQKLVAKIIDYLNQTSLKKIDAFQFKDLTTDALQVICSLIQISPGKDYQDYPYSLYYQVFLQLVKIQNYNSIQETITLREFFIVIDEDNIEITNGLESLRIAKEQVKALAFEGTDNRLVFFTFDIKACDFYINQIELTNVPVLGYSKVLSQTIKNQVAKQVLLSTEWQKIKIHKTQSILTLALSSNYKFFIITFSIFNQEACNIRQFTLEQNIIDLTYLSRKQNLSELIVTTPRKITKYFINGSDIHCDWLDLIHFDFAITKLLLQEIEDQLHVYLYKLHIIQHYIISKGQITSRKRYQLNRKIKIMAVNRQFIYAFYENCDALDIMLFREQQLEHLWSYFWVDFDCAAIHIKEDNLYLQGNSYIKHLRIRNSESLNKNIMKNE